MYMFFTSKTCIPTIFLDHSYHIFIIPMKVRAPVESSKMVRFLVDAKHLKHVTREMGSHKRVAFLRAGSVHKDAKVRARVRRESR